MAAINRKELLQSVRRVVVKIGTAALSDEQGGLDESQVANLAGQVHALRQRGIQAAVVTSGAIGAGMNLLGLTKRPTNLPELQACAAVGQGRLTAVYDQCFQRRGYHAAQVLLTRQDFDNRRRYLNTSNTLHTILSLGATPLINENDCISDEEVAFGDNDMLAALVTDMLEGDALVALTSVDGVCENPDAPLAQRRFLSVVEEVDSSVRGLATTARSRGGSGGMATKLEAAYMAAAGGALAFIANARTPRVVERIFDGEEIGTLFLPSTKVLARRKRWLRFGVRTKGALVVDAGARKALVENGKSLLPSGIRRVEGDFSRGDLIAIRDEQGAEFARGLANYAADEMTKVMGQRTSALRKILGEAPYEEAVHRDHLVVHP